MGVEMIITIALNPSIEKIIEIEDLTIGVDHNVDNYQLIIGRSSVYSAYIMKLLQAEPYVLGFSGGIGGKYIKNFLDKNRIKSNLIQKDQELESIFVLKIKNQPNTRLIDHSSQLNEGDARNFRHKLVGHINDSHIVLLNGDTLDAVAKTIMEDTMDLSKKEGKKVILSVEGNDIKTFISKVPYAWIVDDEQLEVLGIIGDEEKRIKELHRFLMGKGIHYAFYLTGEGVVGISKNKICMGIIKDSKVEKVSWLKEAIAGGIAIGIKRKYEFERMIKLACGISNAIHQDKYPNICTRKEIDDKMRKCKIIEHYSKSHYHFEDQ